MSLSQEEVEALAEKKLLGTISEAEQVLLDEWMTSFSETEVDWIGADDETMLKQRLFQNIKNAIDSAKVAENPPRVKRTVWKYWAAAALILSFGLWMLIPDQPPTAPVVVAEKPEDIAAPVLNKATITLSNGETVNLTDVENGTLAMQENVSIVKKGDGQLAYEGHSETDEIIYNRLFNPRGSKPVTISLSDGTKVWLNAESAIRYPVAFKGTERKVEVMGEAYFEVSKQEGRSFVVSKDEVSVRVLGTHFNINSYEDVNDIKVTLLEGAVVVSVLDQGLSLKPGQQAVCGRNGGVSLNADVDVEQVMAWKNGSFEFGESGIDLRVVLNQVARWYDVTYEIRGKKDITFGGSISRQANMSEVLKLLELTGEVNFKIENKKIIAF